MSFKFVCFLRLRLKLMNCFFFFKYTLLNKYFLIMSNVPLSSMSECIGEANLNVVSDLHTLTPHAVTFLSTTVRRGQKCGRPCVWHASGGRGRARGGIHIQAGLYGLTSAMSHVAKMHLSNCLAPRGFAGREMGIWGHR